MNARHRSRIFSYGSYYVTTDSSKNAEESSCVEQDQPSTRYRPARSTTRLVGVITLGFLTVVLAGCANPSSDSDGAGTVTEEESVGATLLPEMEVPPDNPLTPFKVALGKQLFFDKRLSAAGEVSCETCHLPEMGWTDGKPFSTTSGGSVNSRHTPTLYNAGYYLEWYWDGRSPTLEAQILAAWRSQMGAEPEAIAARIAGIPQYQEQFRLHMGTPVEADSIVKALATFVRTIVSDDSPWDRYELGDENAVSPEAVMGFDVFSESEKANCTLCHLPPLYTDTLYHNIGVGFDRSEPDLGRGGLLERSLGESTVETEKLRGAFKTPTLRSITETGPYFHDGSAETLEAAVDFVLEGGHPNPYLDEKLQPRNLTAQEKAALMEFLRALTPEQEEFERPVLPGTAQSLGLQSPR